MSATRLPTYFISHGGPNLLDDKDKPGKFYEWFGKTIREKIKPKAIVIISAHWQGEGNGVYGKIFSIMSCSNYTHLFKSAF
jgi:aromatic ring-opening dioxygenase catalytic subunit (LigB family)